MLDNAVKIVFGGKILHQKCIWHALEIVKRQIDFQRARQDYLRFKKKYVASLEDKKVFYHSRREKLAEMKTDLEFLQEEYSAKEGLIASVREMLNQKTSSAISAKLTIIKRRYKDKYPSEGSCGRVISFLNANLEGLTTYIINHDIPKTNIMAENFNRQLQRRLKTIEAFQTVATAFNYLNMIRNYIRFKPYTDCKGKRKYRNHRSPIELCRVSLRSRDWIKNSINYPKLSTAN